MGKLGGGLIQGSVIFERFFVEKLGGGLYTSINSNYINGKPLVCSNVSSGSKSTLNHTSRSN